MDQKAGLCISYIHHTRTDSCALGQNLNLIHCHPKENNLLGIIIMYESFLWLESHILSLFCILIFIIYSFMENFG